MSDGIGTRKLLRQEWRPLGGPKVVRYVVSSVRTIPSKEWTDELQSNSKIENEFIGYAEVEKGKHFGSHDNFEDFVHAVYDEAQMLSWRPDWSEKAHDIIAEDVQGEEDEGEDEDPNPQSDTKSNSKQETPEPSEAEEPDRVTEDDTIVVSDSAGGAEEVQYDPSNEPYRLPRNADIDDVEYGVRYEATIVSVKGYGFFVQVYDTGKGHLQDISGLVHASDIGLQHPSDFTVGERVVVELKDVKDDEGDDISFWPIDTLDSERGKHFPEVDF